MHDQQEPAPPPAAQGGGLSTAAPGSQVPSIDIVIHDTVAAAIAAHAARTVSGVVRLESGVNGLVTHLAARARHQLRPSNGGHPAPTEGVEVTVAGGVAWVHIDLATSGQKQATAVARAVQDAVAAALWTNAGLASSEVSVSVLDIEQSAATQPRGQSGEGHR